MGKIERCIERTKADYTALIVALLDKLPEPELYIMYRTISRMVERKRVSK